MKSCYINNQSTLIHVLHLSSACLNVNFFDFHYLSRHDIMFNCETFSLLKCNNVVI